MAGALAQRFGVGPGDRVALLMANHPEYLTLVNATWWVGAAIAPVNYRRHAREVAWMVADCEAKLGIADEALAGELKALLAADAPETRQPPSSNIPPELFTAVPSGVGQPRSA